MANRSITFSNAYNADGKVTEQGKTVQENDIQAWTRSGDKVVIKTKTENFLIDGSEQNKVDTIGLLND